MWYGTGMFGYVCVSITAFTYVLSIQEMLLSEFQDQFFSKGFLTVFQYTAITKWLNSTLWQGFDLKDHSNLF